MGKPTTTTTKKTAAKRAVKPAAASTAATPEPKPAAAIAPAKPAPKAKRVRKPAATVAKAEKPVSPKRTTTATKTSRKSQSAATKPAYTNDDIALRAYFIAEKRQQLGQHGSPETDWLEAERQLREGVSA